MVSKRRDAWRSLKEKVTGIVDERKKVNNKRILDKFLANKKTKKLP